MNVYLGVYNENQEGKAISNCKLKWFYKKAINDNGIRIVNLETSKNWSVS